MNKKLYYLTWFMGDLWLWVNYLDNPKVLFMEKKLTNNTVNMYKVTGIVDNTTLLNNDITKHYIVSIHTDIDHLLEIAVLEVL